MAAPDVADAAVSSDEFGYLQEVVNDANTIINEAEAWARGTRGGTPVSEEDPNYENNAKYYSEQAQVAKEGIEDLTVSSTTLETGSPASVTKTVNPETGIVNLAFGLPAGTQGATGSRGPSTVWVGTEAPTDQDYTVWLNPEGTSEPVLLTAEQMSYDNSVEYTEGRIGAVVKNIETNIGAAIEAAEQASEAAAEAAAAAGQVTEIAERVSTLETDIIKKIENPELGETQESGILTVSKDGDTENIQWKDKLNYAQDLSNLPYINEVQVVGNLSLENLGIAPAAPEGKSYYVLPNDGIPKTSLDLSVQTSLGLADDATTQIIVNGNTYNTENNVINLGNFLTDNNVINKNYLDNPWFTVNQRGVTSYTSSNPATAGTHLYDRWKVIINETEDRAITANKNSLYIGMTTHQDPSDSIVIGQLIDDNTWNSLSNKQVTASVNYSFDGTTFKTVSWSFTCPLYNGAASSYDLNRKQFDKNVGWGAQVLIQEFNNKKYLVFKIFWQGNAWDPAVGDSTIYITRTKLELGAFSTLNQESMPLYDEELKKCQRYLMYYGGQSAKNNNKNNIDIILGTGIARDANILDVVFPDLGNMVSLPSVTLPSGIELQARRGLVVVNTTNQPVSVVPTALAMYAIPTVALTSATFSQDIYYTKATDSEVYTAASSFDATTAASKLYYRKTYRKGIGNTLCATVDRYSGATYAQYESYYVVLPRTVDVTEGDETISYIAFSAEP